MPTTWLPHPPLQERRNDLTKILTAERVSERLRLSDFLRPETILFFPEDTGRIQIGDALLHTLRRNDFESARQAVWRREGDLPLRLLSEEVVILRGRLPTLHHLQVALALCPSSQPSATLLFIGPVDQNRLHAGMLVAVSSLFSKPGIAQKLACLRSAESVLVTLQTWEGKKSQPFFLSRFLDSFWKVFRLRFAGIDPAEGVVQ